MLALKHCYLLNKAILLVCLSTLTFNLTQLKITWEESLGPEIIQIRLAWALVAVIYIDGKTHLIMGASISLAGSWTVKGEGEPAGRKQREAESMAAFVSRCS